VCVIAFVLRWRRTPGRWRALPSALLLGSRDAFVLAAATVAGQAIFIFGGLSMARAAEQVKNLIEETAGKATGDTKTEAEGKAEKAAGTVKSIVGGMKDAPKAPASRDFFCAQRRSHR
jgi:uncharacterized protein YjbJ (UPF0337 family)